MSIQDPSAAIPRTPGVTPSVEQIVADAVLPVLDVAIPGIRDHLVAHVTAAVDRELSAMVGDAAGFLTEEVAFSVADAFAAAAPAAVTGPAARPAPVRERVRDQLAEHAAERIAAAFDTSFTDDAWHDVIDVLAPQLDAMLAALAIPPIRSNQLGGVAERVA